MSTLVVLRAIHGDLAGAGEVLSIVLEGFDEMGLRRSIEIILATIHVHFAVAQGDVEAAGEALRHVEVNWGRFSTTPIADHCWFSSAADIAALTGDLEAAATLVIGAEAANTLESHPFVTDTLRARHGLDPRWIAGSLDRWIAGSR